MDVHRNSKLAALYDSDIFLDNSHRLLKLLVMGLCTYSSYLIRLLETVNCDDKGLSCANANLKKAHSIS